MFQIPDNLFCEILSGKSETQFSMGSLQISKNFASAELTETINSLLEAEEKPTKKSFRFFVNGKLLQSDLASHMAKYGLHGESKIQIVFEDGDPPPQIGKRIEFKDWVCQIDFLGKASQRLGIVGLFSGRMAVLDHSLNQLGIVDKSRIFILK